MQLTYRPSGDMRVLDKTWNDRSIPIDYSFKDDRYPSKVEGEPWGRNDTDEIQLPRCLMPISDTDVNFTGRVKTSTFNAADRTEGPGGRDNHISIREREEDARALERLRGGGN
jgi:hypothetical protein